VATLKCGGPPTMPEENRGPWSKKFENRCTTVQSTVLVKVKSYLDHSASHFVVRTTRSSMVVAIDSRTSTQASRRNGKRGTKLQDW